MDTGGDYSMGGGIRGCVHGPQTQYGARRCRDHLGGWGTCTPSKKAHFHAAPDTSRPVSRDRGQGSTRSACPPPPAPGPWYDWPKGSIPKAKRPFLLRP